MRGKPKFIVVIKMPVTIPEKITKAGAIGQSLESNSYYPVPSPAISVFKEDIKNALDAQSGTKTKPPTYTIAKRNQYVATMETDIESYRIACQGLVNNAPNENKARKIVQSFTMEFRGKGGNTKQQDKITEGNTPNSALYKMQGRGAHQVQISYDKGATHQDIDPSSSGKTEITNLQLNTNFWLRNRQILPKHKYSEWTDWKLFAISK